MVIEIIEWCLIHIFVDGLRVAYIYACRTHPDGSEVDQEQHTWYLSYAASLWLSSTACCSVIDGVPPDDMSSRIPCVGNTCSLFFAIF